MLYIFILTHFNCYYHIYHMENSVKGVNAAGYAIRGGQGMLTLELAWLELWLAATMAHRPPPPDEPLPEAEAAATGDANSVRSHEALAHEALGR